MALQGYACGTPSTDAVPPDVDDTPPSDVGLDTGDTGDTGLADTGMDTETNDDPLDAGDTTTPDTGEPDAVQDTALAPQDSGLDSAVTDTFSDTHSDTATSDTGEDTMETEPDTDTSDDTSDTGDACRPDPCASGTCEPTATAPGYICVLSPIVNVRDHGAIPDDGVDDGPGIRGAIAEAATRDGATEVRFEGGSYTVSAEGNHHLYVGASEGLTLRGERGLTRIVMTEPTAHGLYVDGATALTVAGLVFDYDPVPFTQGTVVAVNHAAGAFEVALDAAYPRFDHPMFDASAPGGVWGIVAESGENYELVPVFPDGLPSTWPEVSPGVFRIETLEPASLATAQIEEGARYVSLARGGGHYANALNFWRTDGLTVTGVEVHASPGLAMLLAQTSDVLIDDYHVRMPPMTDRALSTNADGVHSLGVRGTFEIRGCSFEGMADDSINIHGRSAGVTDAPSLRRLRISLGGTVAPRVGEEIAVYDPDAGVYRGQAIVTTVEEDGPYAMWLTLDRDISGIEADAGSPESSDWLFNLDACGAGALIHDNHFGRHRGRAMVLRAPDVQVYDNTIENVDGLAVAVLLNGAWGEGPIPGGVVVRDNTITGVSRDINEAAPPALLTGVVSRQGGYTATPVIADVTVQNNVFEGLKGLTMAIGNAVDFRILGNWTNNTRQNKVGESASVLVRPGSTVNVQSYAVSDMNPETYAGIHVQDGGTCVHDGLNMSLVPGVPWVRDDGG